MKSNTKVTVTFTPKELKGILQLYLKGSADTPLEITNVDFKVDRVYHDSNDTHGSMELTSIECIAETEGVKIPRP